MYYFQSRLIFSRIPPRVVNARHNLLGLSVEVWLGRYISTTSVSIGLAYALARGGVRFIVVRVVFADPKGGEGGSRLQDYKCHVGPERIPVVMLL